jgi:YtxH-like protein
LLTRQPGLILSTVALIDPTFSSRGLIEIRPLLLAFFQNLNRTFVLVPEQKQNDPLHLKFALIDYDSGEMKMKLRKNTLLDVLMGAGLFLLDPVRDRLADSIESLTNRAQDTFDTASDRIGRASSAIRGEDDNSGLSSTAALLIGVGIGVGVGMLLAPASGEETRSNLSEKVHNLGDRMRDRFTNEPRPASGTYGE